MQRHGYRYSVTALVYFTPREVDILMELSDLHYDGRCRAASKVGGFLYGIKVHTDWNTEDGTENPCRVSSDEVDLLCKILEPRHGVDMTHGLRSHWDLYKAMRDLLRDIIDEWNRVNA